MLNKNSFQTVLHRNNVALPIKCIQESTHPNSFLYRRTGVKSKYYKKYLKTTESCEITRQFSKEENNSAITACEHLLPKPDCILLQCKHIVSKYDDFIIPSLVKLNQELAGSEFIWVHGVQQYPFLRFDSYVFSIKFRWHWAPNLELKNIHTQSNLPLLIYFIPVGTAKVLGGWQSIMTFCIVQATDFNTVIFVPKRKLPVGVVSSTAKLCLTSPVLCPSKMLWQWDWNKTGRYFFYASYLIILLNATTFLQSNN